MAEDDTQSLRERAEAMIESAVEASSGGDWSGALTSNDAALDICRHLVRRSAAPAGDDATLLLACLRNATIVRRSMGRGEDALAFAQEAVDWCREHSSAFNLASCLNSLAVTHRASGRLDHAIPAIEEAISVIWSEFESKPDELAEMVGTLLGNIGQWYREAGQSPPARLAERFNQFSALFAEEEDAMRTAAVNPASTPNDIADRLLSEVAKVAMIDAALNEGSKIAGWACQLIELLASLAWRIRGLHVNLRPQNGEATASHWLVVLPSGSPQGVPLKALSAARNVMAERISASPSAATLTTLTDALHATSNQDPLTAVARSVEQAGRARTLTPEVVDGVITSLLSALRVTAVELEASEPKMVEPGYIGDHAAMPIAAPLVPTAGEAMRVIAHVVEVTEHHFGTTISAIV